MKKQNFAKILWIVALILGALAILGSYDIVVIKGLHNYNFEMLLIGYLSLVLLRFIKK